MSGILTITASAVFRPFRNKLDLYLFALFEGLFCLGCLGLCILMATSFELTPSDKLRLGVAVAAIFIALSILLFIYNLAMIVVQAIKHCTGKNYL